MTVTAAKVRRVAPQRILGLRESFSIDSEVPTVESLFERVIDYMEGAGADRTSPISWRSQDDDMIHLGAGFVAPTTDVAGLDSFDLPAATVAAVVRRGAVDTIDEAHQAIRLWAEAHHHTASVEQGRWRELYLETDDANHSDWLVEVQLELLHQ